MKVKNRIKRLLARQKEYENLMIERPDLKKSFKKPGSMRH
jgi:hypothetical protein